MANPTTKQQPRFDEKFIKISIPIEMARTYKISGEIRGFIDNDGNEHTEVLVEAYVPKLADALKNH